MRAIKRSNKMECVMNKKKLFFILFLLIIFFVSCNDSVPTNVVPEEQEEEEVSILGQWNWVKNTKDYFMRLDSDHSGILHYYQSYGGSLNGYVNVNINWSFDKNSMIFTILVPGQIAGWYDVSLLTETELKLEKHTGYHQVGFGLTDSVLTR